MARPKKNERKKRPRKKIRGRGKKPCEKEGPRKNNLLTK
jgi:hypothetical protein